MDIEEYRAKVISLFRSGEATESHWQEMASAILEVSENEMDNVWGSKVADIDKTILATNPTSEKGGK